MDEGQRRMLRSAIEAIRRGEEFDKQLLAPLFGRVPADEEAAAARNLLASFRLASVEDVIEMVARFVRRLPAGTSPLRGLERSVDELFRAVAENAPISNPTRHAFGILSRHHERALREAIRTGRISRPQALSCAHDGRALTRLLGDLAETRVPIEFRTTDFFGMPQVLREMHDEQTQLLDRVPVRTSGGAFQLLVSNESELRMANGEPDTGAWLERTLDESSVLWDVGANVGFFSLYAARVKPGVRCVAFEPSPHNFARLNENLRINGLNDRVVAFPIACSDRSGFDEFRMSFFYAGGWSQQGILDREEVAEFKAHDRVFRIGCVMVTLDECLERGEALPAPTHLKIDVDGPELRVLRGAQRLLRSRSLRHLLVELRDDDEAAEAASMLRACGFERSHGPRSGPGNRFFQKPIEL